MAFAFLCSPKSSQMDLQSPISAKKDINEEGVEGGLSAFVNRGEKSKALNSNMSLRLKGR